MSEESDHLPKKTDQAPLPKGAKTGPKTPREIEKETSLIKFLAELLRLPEAAAKLISGLVTIIPLLSAAVNWVRGNSNLAYLTFFLWFVFVLLIFLPALAAHRSISIKGFILFSVVAMLILAWIPRNTPLAALPSTSTPTLTTVWTPTPSSTLTPIPISTSTPTGTPIPCAYQGANDLTTFTNLINAEADAVNKADFKIIQTIFSPNALIHDFNPERVWYSPVARYQDDLFQNTKFKGAQHFDIFIDGRSSSTMAWATSGSRGFYLDPGGVWMPYENPSAVSTNEVSGSDHWTFGRNEAGCWLIIRYEFNASKIPFP